ncbi:MAG: OsmC family protein [bacterium]
MKITLLGDDAIRYEAAPGPLTIEAASEDLHYSPFHMLASGLASCTYSVLYSWATHAKVSADGLILEVQWRFADDPHRVADIGVVMDWPALPPDRLAVAKRVAALCTIHATLEHPPRIDVLGANETQHDHEHVAMHGEPAAAPGGTSDSGSRT